MSEQKMPAFYSNTHGHLPVVSIFTAEEIERIRAEAIEFGRQQERERLEPLRVAVEVEALAVERDREAQTPESLEAVLEASDAIMKAARNLLEQPE